MNELSHTLNQLAPEALNLALRTVHINALLQLFGGAFILILAVPLAVILLRVCVSGTEPASGEAELTFREVFTLVAVTVFAFMGVVAGVALLADPWLYIALTNPKLRLVHDLLTGRP